MFWFHRSMCAFGLLVLMIAVHAQASKADADVTTMSVNHLARVLDANVKVIDVRRDDEWRVTGVIEGSQLITAYDANGRLDPDFVSHVMRVVGPDKPVALICRSGRRSMLAAQLLAERAGFTNVVSVDGGIKAWVRSHKPVSPCSSC